MHSIAVALAWLWVAQGCPEPCRCLGEFLECSGRNLTSLRTGMFEWAGAAGVPELYLDHNGLEQLPAGALAPLRRLRVLSLYNNSLAALPEDAFAGLDALEYLHLRDNHLHSLPAVLFTSQAALRLLDVRDNRLTTLSVATLSPLRHLQALRLRGNPLLCDCALRPAAAWVAHGAVETDGECEGPQERRGRGWDEDHPCEAFPWRTLALATLSVPAACLCLCIVVVVVRRRGAAPVAPKLTPKPEPTYDDAGSDHHYETIPAHKRCAPDVVRYVSEPSHLK